MIPARAIFRYSHTRVVVVGNLCSTPHSCTDIYIIDVVISTTRPQAAGAMMMMGRVVPRGMQQRYSHCAQLAAY